MSWCNHSSVNGTLPLCTPDEAGADFRRDARPAPASENEALQLACVDHRRVFVCPVRRAHVDPRGGGGRDDTFHCGDSPSNDRRGRGGVGHGCPGRIGVVPGRYRRTLAGNVSRVAPIDKLSTVLAILLALILLGEPVSAWGAAGIVAITAGTLLMVEPSDLSGMPRALRGGGSWLVYALASALFAALTSILGKVGISGVDPTLGTAVRTVVVLAMAWVIVTVQGRLGDVRDIPTRELAFIVASGAATCASWLAYYHALKDGPASVVVPIDKLSILVTVAFSAAVFHERFTRRYLAGLALMCVGTGAMVVA